jgi:hypothetical protein
MGFTKKEITPPHNYLTDGHSIYSRRYYRHWGKRHFKYKMPWDDSLTDTENLANNGWYWIYDCGKIKNVWMRENQYLSMNSGNGVRETTKTKQVAYVH